MSVIEFSPGAMKPFDGRGSSQQDNGISRNWAIASNGLISMKQNYQLPGFVYGRGRYPYGVCYATGYRYPLSEMTTVDGKMYIPDFAPGPQEGW